MPEAPEVVVLSIRLTLPPLLEESFNTSQPSLVTGVVDVADDDMNPNKDGALLLLDSIGCCLHRESADWECDLS